MKTKSTSIRPAGLISLLLLMVGGFLLVVFGSRFLPEPAEPEPKLDLAPPVIVTRPEALPARAASVLIYYANETAPTEAGRANYDTILGWLHSSDVSVMHELAEVLESDAKEFPAAIDEETDMIRSALAGESRPALQSISVAIFTNRLTRRGVFLAIDQGEVEEVQFRLVIDATDAITESSPLCSSVALRAALEATTERFPSEEFGYVLVLKSHGAADLAMTPRLAVHHEQTSREELLAFLERSFAEGHEHDPDQDEVTPDLFIDRRGVGKEDFFRVIAEAGEQQDLVFTAIFLESCQSGLELPATMPPNIGTLHSTGPDGAPFRNLDYTRLLDEARGDSDLASALQAELDRVVKK